MNDFDQRWQLLAQHARRIPDEAMTELPLGFATRIMARVRESSGEAWVDVFNILGLRAVLATSFAFLLSAGFAYSDWFENRIEPPALDRIVTSDLSWP